MIRQARDAGVAVIEIDRHERRNALDTEHCLALRDAVRGTAAGGARAIVITGAGTTFCAGADLAGVYGDAFRDALYGMLTAVTSVGVPVIAAVNGPAIGAGTQLALACDLRVAAPAATFSIPTARNGLAVDPWTVSRLTLLAGGGTAQAVLIGCDSLDLEAARRCGLVQRSGDHAAALRWAQELAELAPLTLAYSKRAINAATTPAASDPEVARAYAAVWASEDMAEGRRARGERRAPRFQGR